MLRVLKVSRAYSPNMIAKKISCDKRTVEKMLKTGIKLNMIKCKDFKLGNRTYRACRLSKNFKKFLK